jgi:hypothetical protein
VNEWHQGDRHHHILLRAPEDSISAAVPGLSWASCRGARVTAYCRPVRTVEGAARYIVKDLRDSLKKEVPPADFCGRLFSYSKRFLAQPLKAIMRAMVEEWRVQACKRI